MTTSILINSNCGLRRLKEPNDAYQSRTKVIRKNTSKEKTIDLHESTYEYHLKLYPHYNCSLPTLHSIIQRHSYLELNGPRYYILFVWNASGHLLVVVTHRPS